MRAFLQGLIECSAAQQATWHRAVMDAEGPLLEVISFHDYISNTWNQAPPSDAASDLRDPATTFNRDAGILHPMHLQS